MSASAGRLRRRSRTITGPELVDADAEPALRPADPIGRVVTTTSRESDRLTVTAPITRFTRTVAGRDGSLRATVCLSGIASNGGAGAAGAAGAAGGAGADGAADAAGGRCC